MPSTDQLHVQRVVHHWPRVRLVATSYTCGALDGVDTRSSSDPTKVTCDACRMALAERAEWRLQNDYCHKHGYSAPAVCVECGVGLCDRCTHNYNPDHKAYGPLCTTCYNRAVRARVPR